MFSSPHSISEPGTHTRDPTTGPGDTAESLPASVTSRVDSCDNADPFPNSCQILFSVATAASDEEGNGLELCDARISSIAADSNNSLFRNFQNETCWTGINDLSLLDSITAWSVLESNVPHAAVTRLLLSLNGFHPELPKTFHTLLPQPKLQHHPMGERLYVHLPNWISSLKSVLTNAKFNSQSPGYTLVVNIDGLPLFSSTPNYKLFPILITLHKIKMRPLCAGIYCTEISSNREMPSTYEFLKRF